MDTTDKTKSAISTNSLQGATPINIPPLVPPNYDAAFNTGVTQTQEALNAATLEQQAQAARQEQLMGTGAIASLQMQKANQAVDTAQAYQNSGVNDLMKQLSGYNVQAQGLQREAQAAPIQTQLDSIGRGRTDAGIAPLDTAKRQDIALRSLALGQQAAIAQGNYDIAKTLADQQIATKYAGIDAEIAARETQLKGIHDYLVTPAQQKAAAAQTALLEKQKQEFEQSKLDAIKTEFDSVDLALAEVNEQLAEITDGVLELAAETARFIDRAHESISDSDAVLDQYLSAVKALFNVVDVQKKQLAKIQLDKENAMKELAAEDGRLEKKRHDLHIYRSRLDKKVKELGLKINILL